MNLQASVVKPHLAQSFVIRDLRFGMNRQEATIDSLKKHRLKVSKEIQNQRWTLGKFQMNSISIRFEVWLLITVLAHQLAE